MSSRLVGPDPPHVVEPMRWRIVGPDESSGSLFAAGMPLTPLGEGSEFERRIEQRLHEAYAAGVREGEASASRRAESELRPVIERLARSVEEISSVRARLRREAEQDLIRLALAIARRILGRELAVDPDAVHGLIVAALEKLRAQEICRVRVHPAHQAALTACLKRIITDSTPEVISDASCEPGTVILETERGRLDASVESQLQEIERGLTDRLRRRA